MQVEILSPLVDSTIKTFAAMLNCELQQGDACLSEQFHPHYEVCGIIHLSGAVDGKVVFSMDRNVAITVAEQMLGNRPDTIDENVMDAAGEIANIVAGHAKSDLEALALRLSLPEVIVGDQAEMEFPAADPISIPFECEWGRIRLDVSFANCC